MEMKNLPGKCEIGKCVIFWLPTSCKRFWQKLWNSNSACSSYTKNAGNLFYTFLSELLPLMLYAVCWLGGLKGIQPVKNSGWVLAWLSFWSEVQTCIWPSWCHCHSLSLASVKSRLVLPFWYRLTRVVPDKGPLNRCVCVCVAYFLGKILTKHYENLTVLAQVTVEMQRILLWESVNVFIQVG